MKFIKINLKSILLLMLFITAFFTVFFSSSFVAHAATTTIVPYQGKLTNLDGTNVADGSYNFNILFYNAVSSGTCVYTISGTCGTPTTVSATVTNGIFFIAVGDTGTNSLSAINFNQDLWMEVRVGGDTLTPRKRITGASFTPISNLNDANASNTADNTNFTQTWNWSTLSTQTGFALASGSSATTGTLLGLTGSSYNPGAGNTGSLVNLSVADTASNTTSSSIVNGINLNSTINTSGATGTKFINLINIAAPTKTACTGGACTWTGINVADPGTLANTTFYAATFQGGNVGVGNATPSSLFSVGSSSQLQVTSAGNLSTSGTFTSSNSASASTSSILTTGTLLTGGTATTNFPQFFQQPTGATAVTTWSTNGTFIGVNSATGFTGNFLDFHVNGGASLAKLDSGGNLTVTSCTGCGGGGASRLDQITAANTTATIDSLTNAITWNWSTLTTQTALTLGSTTSAATTGTILAVGPVTYAQTTAGAGSLANFTFTNTASNTSGNTVTNGIAVGATLNTSGATGTKETNAFKSTTPTLTGCSGGNCILNGFNAYTATSGFASTITQNGFSVTATGASAGTLNGINIGSITAGAGTESAINIGTGWDNSILGAGALTVATSANGNISFLPNGTGGVITTSGATTGDAFTVNANSVTQGRGLIINANGLTTGQALLINSSASGNVNGVLWLNSSASAGDEFRLSGTSQVSGNLLYLDGSSTLTTGTLIYSGAVAYNHTASSEIGNAINLNISDTSNNGFSNTTTNILNLASTLNTSAAGAKAFNIINIPTPTKTACTTGACTWTGLNVADPGTLANATFYAAVFQGGNVGIGTATPTAGLQNATAGAASKSAELLSGAILTGGTGTTNFPQFFIQPTAATGATTWSTAGTALGVNTATGFTGNFLDFHVNGGASVAKLDNGGNLTVTSCTGCGGGATRLDQITAANTTATIDSLTNTITWNWSTLTTQTALSLGTTTTALTTGTVFNVGGGTTAFVHTTAETGSLSSFTIKDSSTNASGATITNGINLSSTLNTTGAGTKSINPINIVSPTLIACTSGACTWNGLNVNTATTGFLSTVTQNGLNITSTGASAGTLNGINIGNITAGGGTESAINIGTGWDNSILGAGALSVATSANGNISFAPNGTGNISFTTGTTSGDAFAITANSAATNNAVHITANNIDSGAGLFVTSTAAMNGGGDVAWFQNNSTSVSNILFLSGDSMTTGVTLALNGNVTGSTAGFTTGGIITSNGAERYRHTIAETGNFVNFGFIDTSLNTTGTAISNGINFATTINTTGAGTKNINVFNIPTPTKTACATGTCVWTGLNIAAPGSLANTTFTPISVSGGLFKVDAGGNITVASCTGCGSSAALSGITAATATNTIDNQTAGTAFGQIWNWSTLTTQTGFSLGTNTTAATTGGILAVGGTTYVHTTAETGNLSKFTFTDASTNASGATVTNGLNVISTVNTSGAGTKTISPINVSAPTLTACASGACTWNGLNVNTATSGAASTITQNGLNVVATGVASGTLNGLSIGTITGGAGTENALNIGTGWDNIISSTNFSVTGAGVVTGGTYNGLTLANVSTTPVLTNGTIWYNSTSNRFQVVEGGVSKQLCNATDLACGAGSGAAISALTAATVGNTINNVNFAQDWGWGSLTTQTALHLGGGNAMTTGTVLAAGGAGAIYVHTTAETGSLVTNTVLDQSTIASGTSVTNGETFVPTVNATSGAGTRTINAINITPTWTACTAGVCNLNAINIANVTRTGTGTTVGINIGSAYDTQFQLGAKSGTDLPAAASSTLNVFVRDTAGREMLTVRDDKGTSYALQPSLAQTNWCLITPNTLTTMLQLGCSGLTTLTYDTTVSTPAITQSDGYATNFATAAIANDSAGVEETTARVLRGSTATGFGGYFYYSRIYTVDASYGSGATGVRLFSGMSDQAVGNTMVNADNPAGNYTGFQYSTNRSDTNWQFITKDGITQNVVNTSMAFTALHIYDMYLYVARNTSAMYYRIDDLTAGITQSGSTSSNPPTNTTFLRVGIHIQTLTTTARNIKLYKIYTENDR